MRRRPPTPTWAHRIARPFWWCTRWLFRWEACRAEVRAYRERWERRSREITAQQVEQAVKAREALTQRATQAEITWEYLKRRNEMPEELTTRHARALTESNLERQRVLEQQQLHNEAAALTETLARLQRWYRGEMN